MSLYMGCQDHRYPLNALPLYPSHCKTQVLVPMVGTRLSTVAGHISMSIHLSLLLGTNKELHHPGLPSKDSPWLRARSLQL